MIVSEYINPELNQTRSRLAILKQIISLIVLLISINLSAGAQQASVRSNQMVLTDSIVELITQNIPDSLKNDPIAIYLPEATDQSLEYIRSSLLNAGLKVTRDFSTSVQLRIIIDSKNELRRKTRSLYTRSLVGTIAASVYKDDILVWSNASQLNYSDLVERSDLGLIATDWTPSAFDHIDHRRSDRKVLRLIQPLMITGAVATTVLLLFSVRSQ